MSGEIKHPPLKREEVACCVCEATTHSSVEGIGVDFEYRTSKDVHTARRCDGCGVVFLSPRPQRSEFERIYPSNYHSLDFSAEGYGFVHRIRSRLEANRLLRYCKGAPPGARILDVGCGDGFHLDLLRRFGDPSWTLEGMDVDERAIEGARQRGLHVQVSSIEQAELEPEHYDVIYAIQTIEHLGHPDQAFRNVYRALKPSGRFVVVTDNTDTLDFSLFRDRHWGGYHFPRHWYLFNKRALAKLATRSGFEVRSIDTIVSPVNWVYSIHNSLVDRRAPDWAVSFFTLKSPLSLAAFTLVDMPLSAVGRGALLHGVFEKPERMAER
jgi:SAM-dependent methyltransferase